MAMLMLLGQMDINRRRAMRRERVFRDRLHPLDTYNDLELYQRYRFDRGTILDLANVITDSLEPDTNRTHALPCELKLLVALRIFASGSFQQVAGDTVQISQPTMCRVLWQVTEALLSLMGRVICFPSQQEMGNIVNEFYDIAHFPAVVGCVDGTHIWILGPSDHEWRYINRKHYYSIDTQVVLDSRARFINIVAKWPGSTHDSVILRESRLAELMEERRGNEVLLGDSGYPVRSWLMTPFLNPNTVPEQRYNRAHKHTRSLVERGIGQWKRRFHCLHGQLRYTPRKACEIITVCAILHNIAIEDCPILMNSRSLNISHSQMLIKKML
ncbi:putative nuclease HARBI1 [Lineus longissimus]|uniref:putative nuclease HARBI1 n=1 Tax=Lineus longissimus TaxID=88925 RepID=UPI00315CF2A5